MIRRSGEERGGVEGREEEWRGERRSGGERGGDRGVISTI